MQLQWQNVLWLQQQFLLSLEFTLLYMIFHHKNSISLKDLPHLSHYNNIRAQISNKISALTSSSEASFQNYLIYIKDEVQISKFKPKFLNFIAFRLLFN